MESGSRYVAFKRVMRATVEFQFGLSVMAVTMSARVQLSGCEQCSDTLSCSLHAPRLCISFQE